MAIRNITFRLEKTPKSTGGVKYKAAGRDDFTIYLPQDMFDQGVRETRTWPAMIVMPIDTSRTVPVEDFS